MILDLERFIAEEKPKWERLDKILDTLSADPYKRLSLTEIRELELLYQRSSSDLARLSALSVGRETRLYLESLVARAYTEVHGGHGERRRWHPWLWLSQVLPQTFRRHVSSFIFATAILFAGAIFGGAALGLDPAAKEVIMPFSHLTGSPSERVAKEESAKNDRLDGHKASFSGQLMTHNTTVTLKCMALGLTWGVGTLILMFYNGVILGAVAVDYILDGQIVFLFGWLMPHGVIEIPAMLVGGQTGFVLARALIGRGQSKTLTQRLRSAAPDIATLCAGATLMLVWAGIIEAFFSQYHDPVLPYPVKIAFGVLEFTALVWFAWKAGAGKKVASSELGPRPARGKSLG